MLDKHIIEVLKSDGFGEVFFNTPMKNHTTFKIGGPCEALIMPHSVEELIKALQLLKDRNIPHMVMGNGSNLLFSDSGYRGVIVKLDSNFAKILVQGNIVEASSGALLSSVSRQAMDKNLTGLEFASGIPGSIGGAIYMNAGAYGSEIKDVLESAMVLDENLEIRELSNADLKFKYRSSLIQQKDFIVLSAKFNLKEGDPDKIKELFEDLTYRRVSKQPLEYPSAGSTFKRPKEGYASKLIDEVGLRGFRYHNAMISDKHCGFIINCGGATCNDILYLIDVVQKKVYQERNILLEPEVRIIGD